MSTDQTKTPAPGSVQPVGSGWRITIEAVGLRQSDAAAHALRLIGNMMQEAHTKGHCCGSVTGNASGRWELIGPNPKLKHAEPESPE